MDYAIYKTTDGKHPHVVHRFTQQATGHRAKAAARKKLKEMFFRVAQRPQVIRDLSATNDEFQYDYFSDGETKERIKFYISEIKL